MISDFNSVVAWFLDAVVKLWIFFAANTGVWFWLLVSVGITRRVLRLIHRLFKS